MIAVNDMLPNIVLYENNPNTKLSSKDLFGCGKHIVFGLPGAFTPTCSKSHLPGYVQKYDLFKNRGIDSINCISVNDPYVMAAWGTIHQATGKVRMLADIDAKFTKAIGLDIDLTSTMGNIRSQRYVMVVENFMVTRLLVEPKGLEVSCSAAAELIDKLPLLK